MRSLSTSKPSGAAATRSISAPVVAAIAVLAAAALCLGAFALVTYGIDDEFVAWFTRNCMNLEFVNVNGSGLMYGYRAVDWTSVRELLAGVVGTALVVFCAVAAVLCLVFYRLAARRTVVKVETIIDDIMGQDEVRVERYPRAYAAIVARMGELWESVRRRERTIKDESGRKNDLITYLAHDLKTPLASVVGYLNLLCETPEMPTDQRAKCLDITLAKATQLENLIEEFFEISRYSLQQIELQKAPVDLDFMLVQLTEEFQPLFARHGNTLEVSCEEGLTVDADAERLARVFNNILKNAVAYSHEGTPIAIRVLRNERTVCVQFQSQGDTIPRTKLDMLFEKFYRLDEARSGNTGGAGLGLAIAKEIVTLHGGAITAKSEQGATTFTVVLPCEPPAEGRPAGEAAR